jgi:hypothetical protein
MNMPRFTAEDSLYKTNGQYRTGRYTINSSAQMVGPIWPAMEVIEVHGCPPGYVLWEAGEEWGCALVEPPTGGGDSGAPGVPSDSGGGGGGGGGAGKPPKRPPNKPPKTPPKKYRPKSGQPCYVEQSVTSGDVTITDVYLNGKYSSTPRGWRCDTVDGMDSAYCNATWTDGDGNKRAFRCYNGQSNE